MHIAPARLLLALAVPLLGCSRSGLVLSLDGSGGASAGPSGVGRAGGGGGAGGASGGPDPRDAVAYQINALHTGASADTTIVPPLKRRWSKDLGGEVSYPLIVDGRVFVTVPNGTPENFWGARLFALDAETGSTLWGPVELGGEYTRWAGTAFDEGRLFAVNGDGVLSAFDPATGSLAWPVKTVDLGEISGQSSFDAPPVAVDGRVYVSGAGTAGTMMAVDEASGDVLWATNISGGNEASPVVTSAGVYVAYACHEVYDLDPLTGGVLWHDRCPGSGAWGFTPALVAGRLFTRDEGSGVIRDPATGVVEDTFEAGYAIPSFDDARVYYVQNGVLTAHSLATIHDVAWSFAGDGMLMSTPLVVNGHVYVGSDSGMLYALDAATGTLVWSDAVGAPIRTQAAGTIDATVGLAAGDGVVVVPAGSLLVVYE